MMVGTYGYMPPEQFQGRASVKSDLYGLGATLLTLATGSQPHIHRRIHSPTRSLAQLSTKVDGRSPASFPQSRLKIDFSQEEGVMPLDLKRVISGLLEPVEEDRLSAKDAMRILDGDIVSSKLSVSELLSLASKKTSPRAGKQQIGRVSWLKDHESLVISIKPKGIEEDALSISTFTHFLAHTLDLIAAALYSFTLQQIAWNAFVFIWTRLALIGAGPIFAAFSLPFWAAGARLGKQTFELLYRGLVSTEFVLAAGKFRMVKEIIPPSFMSKIRTKLDGKIAQGGKLARISQ
eukprot:jgi/Bigna1/90661/estExt_fgenesh1_pg.C_760019